MIRKCLLIIGTVWLSICSYAQSSYEEEALEQFGKGLYHYSVMNMDSAYYYYNSAGWLFMLNGNSEMQLSSFKAKGDCAMQAGEFDLAIKAYDAALDVAQKIEDELSEYRIYMVLRKSYLFKSDINAVMQVEYKIDSLTAATSNAQIKYEILRSLVNDAIQHNNLDLAEHYLKEMEEYSKALPEDTRLSSSIDLIFLFRQLYCLLGRWDNARTYSSHCIALGREVFTQPNNRYLYYMNYDIEAEICARLGNREGAFAALDSIQYGLNFAEYTHPVMWSRYHRCVGTIYMIFQEWDSACIEFRKALDVWSQDSNDYYDEDYSINEVLLSQALKQAGKYEEARACLLDYIQYCTQRFGKGSVEYARALYMLGDIEGWCGDYKQGEQNYSRTVTMLKDYVKNNLHFVSVQERESFWNMFLPIIQAMPAYALKAGNRQDEFVEQCYNGLFITKSFLLESEKSTAALVEEQCLSEERNIYYEYLQLQMQLKELERYPEKNRLLLATVHERLLSANRKLTPIFSRIGYTDYLKTTYQDVKKVLKDNEFLLDFADFRSDKGVQQHVAFRVCGQQKYPELVKSFSTEDIDSLLEGMPLENLYDTNLAVASEHLIWGPITRDIPLGSTVYYVPSGKMHQIVLESLPMQDGSLLGEHYEFVRLTSARELFRNKSTIALSEIDSVVLYGGLDYSLDTSVMLAEAKVYDSLPLNSFRNSRDVRGDSIFSPLPQSEKEVKSIGKTLSKNGITPALLEGAKGSEESFISMSGHAPTILHLATHGFYYSPKDTNQSIEFLQGYKDAMMLTGLAFSGANQAWQGKQLPDGVLGGVLSAYGISNLDFRNTELLVLSACHSGDGEATPEGLFGLQRAFKKAGVRTMILSLWDVDDNVGAEFMARFYEILFSDVTNMHKRAAFNKAKNTIREKYPEPYYWAGFVMLD